MLQLRPSCEHCNKSLPPHSRDAMICSFECTYCKSCALDILQNICPNCGGGFCQRPIRPSKNLKNGNFLGQNPAVTEVTFKPKNLDEHGIFIQNIKNIPSHER